MIKRVIAIAIAALTNTTDRSVLPPPTSLADLTRDFLPKNETSISDKIKTKTATIARFDMVIKLLPFISFFSVVAY
ncbi:MAG: hypothetical protein ACJ749_00950 [Flavisolibacter sp.]